MENPYDNIGFQKGFLRVRLGIGIEKALVDGFWILKKNKAKVWTAVKYEKQLNFCFSCGKRMCGGGTEGNFQSGYHEVWGIYENNTN